MSDQESSAVDEDETAIRQLGGTGNPLLDVDPVPNLPDYEIIGELGRGGMGIVYRARQKSVEREVALKILPSSADEGLIKRFDQEIRITCMLDHPDIVRVYDTGWGENYAWIAMEVLDGFELWEAMPDQRFPLEERISVISRVALALHHAHDTGIVHRDVKPSNIYLTRDGGIRLLDFGVAKMRDVKLTRTGKTVGTPQYMAPEQIMAHAVDARTDVFALASVAYEVLTGSPPWYAELDHQLMMAICTKPPRPFREAFKERGWFQLAPKSLQRLHALIHKSLSAEPTRRHQTAHEFAEALENFLDIESAAAASPQLPDTVEQTVEVDVPREKWSEQRIDWARARAARIRVEAEQKVTENPEPLASSRPAEPTIVSPNPDTPTAAAPEGEEEDSATVLWAALVAVFVIGIGAAVYLLL